MRRKVLGDDHKECGLSLLQIGSIFLELKQWEECMRYFNMSAGVLEPAVGKDHANTQLAHRNAKLCKTEFDKKNEEL
jgi:hypothetical protein